VSKTAEPSEVTPTGQVERPGAGETRALVESFAAIGASNDLNRTADQVLAGLGPLFRCDSATIAIKVLGEGTEIVGHRTRSDGKADRDRPRAEVGKGIVGRVLETGKAALFSVVEEGSPVSSERRPGELRPATRSAMAAPIVGGSGRLLGALLLESNEAGRYDNDALETLMSFGRASAAAVERSLLYAQVLDDERRLEGEMEVARQVMAGILPSETPKLAGFDVAAVIEPCYEVGGDYYDFIRLVDDRWGIAMADVSGKGVLKQVLPRTIETLAFRHIGARHKGIPGHLVDSLISYTAGVGHQNGYVVAGVADEMVNYLFLALGFYVIPNRLQNLSTGLDVPAHTPNVSLNYA